jgi:hypothetical protein
MSVLGNKPPEQLSAADIEGLVDARVPEGRLIDYKRELLLSSDEEKREFLADVSSLANASGGYLIFGVAEEQGSATAILCLGSIDLDATRLRLEHIIRDGIEPRIPRVAIAPVHIGESAVMVIRVPKSFAGPHMVTYKNLSRFYSRNSCGKYQLDLQEIRTHFASSDAAADRLRRYRMERISDVVANEAPVPLPEGAKVVLHIVPLSMSNPSASYDVAGAGTESPSNLRPMAAFGSNPMFTFDGLLYYTGGGPPPDACSGYVQISRSGAIESVDASILAPEEDGKALITASYLEKCVLEVVPGYLAQMAHLGVEPPVLIMLSLMGIRGYRLHWAGAGPGRRMGNPIGRRDIVVPEVVVDSYDCGEIAALMRPVFDIVWNAGGFARSMNYDEEGAWHS